MENSGSVLTLLAAGLAVAYLTYRIQRERRRLRQVIGVLGEHDGGLIDSLELLVRRGELVPVGGG